MYFCSSILSFQPLQFWIKTVLLHLYSVSLRLILQLKPLLSESWLLSFCMRQSRPLSSASNIWVYHPSVRCFFLQIELVKPINNGKIKCNSDSIQFPFLWLQFHASKLTFFISIHFKSLIGMNMWLNWFNQHIHSAITKWIQLNH